MSNGPPNKREYNGGWALPHSEDAETAVLSVLMHDMQVMYERFGSRLRSEHFHHPARALLFAAMIEMHVSALPIDSITLTAYLRKTGELDRVGGVAAVSETFGAIGFMPLIEGYVEILEEMAVRRTMMRKGMEMIEAGADLTAPWKEGLERVESGLFELHVKTSHKGMVHIKTLLPAVLDEIKTTYANRGHVTNGLATGFTTLDRMCMGVKPGLFIIAARPSKGKTVFAGQLCLNIGLGHGDYDEFNQEPTPIGFYSLETRDAALAKRMLLNMARINLLRARDGFMSRAETEQLTESVRTLMNANIYIEACFGVSIQELRSKVRRDVQRYGLKAIVIDYLQLLTSNSKAAQNSRSTALIEVSNGLKWMSEELQIPVFALAQINREGECPRPAMGDIKDSGQIEQDADYITILCNAPEWVGKDDPEDCPWAYLGLDLVKQKDGPTTSGLDPIPLKFLKEYFRLNSLDEKLASNNAAKQQQGYEKKETYMPDNRKAKVWKTKK